MIGMGALVFGSGSARASDGYITGRANLLAGPAADLPDIRILPRGAAVTVNGCLPDWKWCDVTWRGKRGWVASEYIASSYQDGHADVRDVSLRLGIPVITFRLVDYWDKNYRTEDFYNDRDKWNYRFEKSEIAREAGKGSQQQAQSELQNE
jgi:uncharacterized protein YraI